MHFIHGMKSRSNILIYGQPFNLSSGGGITLSNLFKGWPKDEIAVAFTPWGSAGFTTDICRIYYRIGEEEQKWKFPFNLFKQHFPKSGPIEDISYKGKEVVDNKIGMKKFLANKIYNPLAIWLGFHHFNSKIKISEKFKKWLNDFQPDILYLQVSSLESIRFAGDLIDYLRIPSAIHMMDDWPLTISRRGPLKQIWKNKIDKEFRQLLNKVNLYLSISNAMSEEYMIRYGLPFIPFHNPVDIDLFNIRINNRTTTGQLSFKILYVGRIGTANKFTISKFAIEVSSFKSEHLGVEFDIYTNEFDSPVIKHIKNLPNVSIKPAVAHDRIPALLAGYDLLLLPLDFTSDGLRFARLSIPTKATEYMLSGTPILVFAPKETAVSKFFNENDCGYCLISQKRNDVHKALEILIEDADYREKISQNAINLAKSKFDAEMKRAEFQCLIRGISNI